MHQFEFSGSRGVRLARDTAQISIAFIALNRAQLGVVDEIADDLRNSSSAFARNAYAFRLLIAGEPQRAVEVLPPLGMLGGVPNFLAVVHGARAHVFAAAGRNREAE